MPLRFANLLAVYTQILFLLFYASFPNTTLGNWVLEGYSEGSPISISCAGGRQVLMGP